MSKPVDTTLTTVNKSPFASASLTGLVNPTSPIAVPSTPSPRRSPLRQPNNAVPLINIPPSNNARNVFLSQIPGYTPNKLTQSVPPILPSNTNSIPIIPEQNLAQTPLTFETYNGILEDENSVENDLAKYGYVATDKIITRDNDGNVAARYIKATNDRGQQVFVELDIDGKVAVRPTDLTLIESKQANEIPYNVKVGTYNCAGNGVCGVAFECKEGLCTLVRDDNTLQPVESNFVTVQQFDKKSGILEGDPMSYPIVRLSDIKANPDLVAKYIDDSTRRIRNTGYNNCNAEFNNLAKSLDSLNLSYRTLERKQRDTFITLSNTLRDLERMQKDYIVNPPKNETQQNKYNNLLYNIRRRNEYIVELLKVCQRVNYFNKVITSVNNDINDTISYINKEFSGVNFVLPR